MTATVAMVDGTSKRMSLPAAAWEGTEKLGDGISLTAVYIGTRTRRVVEETYNSWQRPGGQESVGTQYSECSQERIAQLAALLPEIEDALDGVIEVEEL